jgi:ABC-type transporter Mla subunit MlaD
MPVLASGSYIWSKDTREGAKILTERAREEQPDEITRILSNVERLTYNLSDAEGSLNRALVQVEEFFAVLSSEDGSLQQTLASLNEITRKISEKEGSIGKLLDDNYELYNNIISITERLDSIMGDFEVLSATVADMSPEIKAAVERSNVAMDEAIGLMKTLQSNFFVRAFSSRKVSQPIPVENLEREGGYR